MFTPFLSVQEKNRMEERLKVEHLSVSFFTDEGEVQAVRDVSFSLQAGEVLAVVGGFQLRPEFIEIEFQNNLFL